MNNTTDSNATAEVVNPFASPKSTVVDTETSSLQQGYYVVSMTKFWVLMISSLSLYSVYWFYKNWALIKERNQEAIWPVPRAVFNIFFTHSLLHRVDADLVKMGMSGRVNATAISVAYVVASILANLIDRAGFAMPVGTSFFGLFTLSLFLTAVAIYALSRAQVAINLASSDPQGDSNSAFSVANWIWIALGLIFWTLSIVGITTSP
jgi:hypothetical protein